MTASIARPQAPWALRLLPPFPAIAHRILALASQEEVGAHEIAALIKLDPSFSAELLRFANSALFCVRRQVTSLTQAVALLGMDRVRSMATFVAVPRTLGTLGLMSAYPDEYSRMLEVSNDFGFDLLQTERDLFEIDHCAAGAYLALDWHFPDQLAAAIATHHDEPVPNQRSLDNLVKVSWRMTDALGYAAFSPAKNCAFEDLAANLPSMK